MHGFTVYEHTCGQGGREEGTDREMDRDTVQTGGRTCKRLHVNGQADRHANGLRDAHKSARVRAQYKRSESAAGELDKCVCWIRSVGYVYKSVLDTQCWIRVQVCVGYAVLDTCTRGPNQRQEAPCWIRMCVFVCVCVCVCTGALVPRLSCMICTC